MSSSVTVVIPAKNEGKLVAKLILSLADQGVHTEVILADAQSTDCTIVAARAMADLVSIPLRVIAGGLPAVGRNAGAKLATSKYVLFVDADVRLASPRLVRDAIYEAETNHRSLVTTDILCPLGTWKDDLLYGASNLSQRLSPFFGVPFATGMFMLWNRERFLELGGFNESDLYAEDYALSKKLSHKEFAVVWGGVETTNRRFEKMGHLKVAYLFAKTAVFGHRASYFQKNQNYWTPF